MRQSRRTKQRFIKTVDSSPQSLKYHLHRMCY